MGNEASSVQKKISNKLLGKRESTEVEISIGAPTSVVHLDKSEVLKLLEKQHANMKGETKQAPKMQINRDVCDKRLESVFKNPRRTSKPEETFHSYIKDSNTENIQRKSSFRCLEKEESFKEELDIGTPTNVVHIGGLDVVKLVEEQAQHCTSKKIDPLHNKRIEEAKEVPKMLFTPDAFNETCEDTFKNTMKPVQSCDTEESQSKENDKRPSLPKTLDIQNVPKTTPLLPPRSPRSLNLITRSEPLLNMSSTSSNLVQDIQRGLESVKNTTRSGRKSEIQDLVKAMHEALDVIMSTYLDNSDEGNEE